MSIKFAYAYARILLVLLALLLFSSFVLHLSVLLGGSQSYDALIPWTFRLTVFVGILAIGFAKDSLRWTDQVKSCPRSMWRSAYGIWYYSLLSFVILIIRGNLSHWDYAFSGFPMGFDAMNFCVIYAAIYERYLNESEVARKAVHSIAFGILVLAMFNLGRYLPRHEIKYSSSSNQ